MRGTTFQQFTISCYWFKYSGRAIDALAMYVQVQVQRTPTYSQFVPPFIYFGSSTSLRSAWLFPAPHPPRRYPGTPGLGTNTYAAVAFIVVAIYVQYLYQTRAICLPGLAPNISGASHLIIYSIRSSYTPTQEPRTYY